MTEDTYTVVTASPEKLDKLRKLTHILYLLYAIFWLTGGITALIAIIINYVKRDEAQGTLYASHFTWQIRSFWWSIAWGIVGGLLLVVLIGFAVFGVLFIWMLHRIVKGWLYLNDGKPMYAQR